MAEPGDTAEQPVKRSPLLLARLGGRPDKPDGGFVRDDGRVGAALFAPVLRQHLQDARYDVAALAARRRYRRVAASVDRFGFGFVSAVCAV